MRLMVRSAIPQNIFTRAFRPHITWRMSEAATSVSEPPTNLPRGFSVAARLIPSGKVDLDI